MDLEQLYVEVEQKLGLSGTLLSSSKTHYRNQYPNHLILFNSNIFTIWNGLKTKIWWGDLNVNLSKDILTSLSSYFNLPLYCLYESDGRWISPSNVDLERAAAVFHPSGDIKVREDQLHLFNP